MRTTRTSNGILFHHNDDYSGNVTIQPTASDALDDLCEIPCADIFEFVAEYIRKHKITKIEQSSWDEILLGK